MYFTFIISHFCISYSNVCEISYFKDVAICEYDIQRTVHRDVFL